MCEVQKPHTLASPRATLSASPVNPQGRIQLYGLEEWEEFIREWVTALEATYVQIKRFGGTSDHGADVAAFKSDLGLASKIDFAMFKSVELLDAVSQHETMLYHIARFGTALADRLSHQSPPAELEPIETRYVGQLLEVHNERHPRHDIRADNVSSGDSVGEHFQRQREASYKAESLRVYARDSVPPGTFDLLQGDIYTGVVDIADDAYPDGWTRMSKVLMHVGTLDLHNHALIQVSDLEDRKGIYHQQANTDRVTWVRSQ